jgi:hypothetical protein
MQFTIRRATADDAEAVSAIWEVVCAERVYTAVNRPFTFQREREYITSRSYLLMGRVSSAVGRSARSSRTRPRGWASTTWAHQPGV